MIYPLILCHSKCLKTVLVSTEFAQINCWSLYLEHSTYSYHFDIVSFSCGNVLLALVQHPLISDRHLLGVI